jgi:hypothetical protein
MFFVGRVAIPEYKSISWTFEWMVLLNWNSKQTRWVISDDESGIPLLCVLDHAFVDDILMPVAIPTCFLQIGYHLWVQADCLHSGMKNFVELETILQKLSTYAEKANHCRQWNSNLQSLSFWSRLQSKHLSVSACHLSIWGHANRNIFAFWSHTVWLFFDSGSTLGTCSPG